MIRILDETAADIAARDAVLDRAMGPSRFLKPSQRLRDGRLPAAGLSLVARLGAAAPRQMRAGSAGQLPAAVADAAVVGTVRLWEIDAGGCPALLLGPLAVAPEAQGTGVGSALMRSALARAAALGHGAVILVGDEPYYRRFGFSAALTRNLVMPGRVDPARLLAVELEPGALARAAGPVTVPRLARALAA